MGQDDNLGRPANQLAARSVTLSPCHLVTLSRARVVLVRPKTAANLGAVARVMRNFGLGDLALVAPEAEVDDPRGRLLATHSEDILERARVVPDFDSAVGDCLLVAGTSARTGGLFRRQTVGTPEQILPRLLPALAAGPVGLVFGPESSGLTNDEVARCHYLIHIPADEAHPSLNLAQAVAICLYELRRAWLAGREPPGEPDPLADFATQEHMFARLRAALEEIHFLYGPKADSLMHALRHLLGRARLTEMEAKLLLGLARQIRWYVAHGGPGDGEGSRGPGCVE
jgi:tRNA/rRNA methyltransferase